jgi:hypothetical protein
VSVFASCGCEVHSGDGMVPVEFDDEAIDHDARDIVPVVTMAIYCRKCAKLGSDQGWLRIQCTLT